MKKWMIAGLTLCTVVVWACKTTPKKEEPPPLPVVTEPIPEPVVAKRAAPVIEEEPMEVAVRPELVLRATPGRSGKILDAIPYGAGVMVVDRSASEDGVRWLKVKYRDKTGYVFAKYLRSPGEKRNYSVTKRVKRKRRR